MTVRRTTVGCVFALLLGVSAEDASVKMLELPFEDHGRPVIREDFERCEPAHTIKVYSVQPRESTKGCRTGRSMRWSALPSTEAHSSPSSDCIL